MKTEKPLTPYERWMVRSNLKTIRNGEFTADQITSQLRQNGYVRVANAVASHLSKFAANTATN